MLIVRATRQLASTTFVDSWFSDRPVRPAAAGTLLGGHAIGHVVIDDRLLNAPLLRREMAGDLTSLVGGLGVGSIELANADGALDGTRADLWRSVDVWLVADPASQGLAPDWASALFLFRADCGRADYLPATGRPARVIIGLLDAMARLDRPLQAVRYAGTNNGTTVLYEGEAGGLKGRVKPVLIGDLSIADGAAQLPAPQVNAARLTYQLHDGALTDRPEVLDRGVTAGLADDGDYTGSAFDSRVVPAASYCTDVARGLVKTSSGLIGPVTFAGANREVRSGPDRSGAPWAIAQVIAKANVTPGAKGVIGLGDLAPLEGTSPDRGVPVGWWFGDEVSVRDAVGVFARSGAGLVVAGRDGNLVGLVVGAAASVPDLTLQPHDLISFDAAATAPSPVGAVRVGWGRAWSELSGQDVAPSARGTPDEERLANSWRWAVQEDAATQARVPDWRTVTIETALRSEAAALVCAGRLLSAFALRPDGQARRVWTVRVPITADYLAMKLGQTVRVISGSVDELLILTGETIGAASSGGVPVLEWSLFG